MAGGWPGLTGSSSGLGGQLCTSESPPSDAFEVQLLVDGIPCSAPRVSWPPGCSPWLCDNLMLGHCVCLCWLTGPSLAGWGCLAQTSIIPGFRVGVIGSCCAGSASLGSPLCWEVDLVYLGSPLKCGGVSDSLGSSSRRRAGSASLGLLMGCGAGTASLCSFLGLLSHLSGASSSRFQVTLVVCH